MPLFPLVCFPLLKHDAEEVDFPISNCAVSRAMWEGESEPCEEGAGSSGRPMVISSGMQSMDTMKQVYQIVKPLNPNFCFLQCTSAYPLQPEDANLRVISVSVKCGSY